MAFIKKGNGVYLYMENKGIINYQSTVTNTNQNVGDHSNLQINSGQAAIDDLANLLIEAIKTEDSIEPTVKEELEEVINAATEEAVSEKPKKGILKSFLDRTQSVIDTISKTPNIITAYEKWSLFIQNIVDKPSV